MPTGPTQASTPKAPAPATPSRPSWAQVKYAGADPRELARLRASDSPYAQGYEPAPQSIEELPNYDRLSRWERNVTNFVPGFAAGPVGRALAYVNGSWLGKNLLPILDILAEGTERGVGFVAQYIAAGPLRAGIGADQSNFANELTAAWYAGSLSADMANLPTVQNGHLLIRDDLPGIDGIIQARQQISQLMAGGMSGQEALTKVREGYYSNLGALAIRSQLQDAFFHIAADPLNVVMPFIKPIERLALAKIGWLNTPSTAQLADRIAELTSHLDDLKAAGAGHADEIARIEQAIESAKLGRIGGDTAAEIAAINKAIDARAFPNGVPEATDIAGKLAIGEARAAVTTPAEVERLAELSRVAATTTETVAQAPEGLAELQSKLMAVQSRAGTSAEEVARLEESIKIFQNAPTLLPYQEKLMKVAGAIPTEGRGWLQRFWRSKWNPLGLTPESRAHELSNVVVNRILVDVVGRIDDQDEILRVMRRIAAGLTTPELGASVVTTEGRAVRAVVQASLARIEQNVNAFNLTSFERGLFERLGSALGEDPAKLFFRVMGDEQAQVLDSFKTAFQRLGPDAQKEFTAFLARRQLSLESLTPDLLRQQAEVFGEYRLLTPEILKAYMVDSVAESSARLALVQFGVKSRGFLQHMAGTMKQAETLAFLRINPSFALRNFMNNEFTAMARGSYSLMSQGTIENFWKVMGFEAPRLRQGYTIAADVGEAATLLPGKGAELVGHGGLEAAESIIAEATAGKTGWLNRVGATLRRISLGPLDVGKLSGRLEAEASSRLMTVGTMRGMRYFRDVPRMPANLVSEIGEEAARIAERTLGGIMTEADIDKAFTELGRVSAGNILDVASKQVGTDLSNIVGHEELGVWADRIVTAAQRGGARGIREEAEAIRAEARQLIQASLGEEAANRLEHIAARVETEGPLGIAGVWGDRMDAFWGSHSRWDLDVSEMAAKARQATAAGERGAAGVIWREVTARSAPFWKNEFDRVESTVMGIQRGLQRAEAKLGKLPVIDEALQGVSRWRAHWSEFFTWRNKAMQEFFDNAGDGRRFEDVAADVASRYQKLAAEEDAIMARVDASIGQLIPEGARPMWASWRDSARRLRTADREAVIRFRENPLGDGRRLFDLTQEEMAAAYQRERSARLQRMQELVQNERQGVAAMAGDRASQARFQAGAAKHETIRVYQGRPKGWVAEGGVSPDWSADRSIADTFAGEGGEVVAQDVPRGVWQQAMEAKATERVKLADEAGTTLPQSLREPTSLEGSLPEDLRGLGKPVAELEAEAAQRPFVGIPRLGELSEDQMFMGEGVDRLLYERGDSVIDGLRDAALREHAAPPIKMNLTPEGQAAMRQWIAQGKMDLASTKYKAVRFGEYTRDAGLLNYNRRLNYNTWLGTILPYEFWTTTSIYKWAIHSIDRPAMLSTYLRTEKFLRTAYSPRPGRPARLEGKIRIPLPFLPKWMGGALYVDPLGSALPFRQWEIPFQAVSQQTMSDQAAGQRVLEELLNDGKVSQAEYDEAIQTHAGPAWDRALLLARQDDSEGRQSPLDVAALLTSPHAPLMWAYNLLRGRKEDIGPAIPLTRTIKGVTAILGIGPPGGVNVEGAVRTALGLPAFDEWDDYRVDRMLANMAGTGEISAADARRAMIDRQGANFQEAERRAGVEFGWGVMGSSLGMPTNAYPEGEENLRNLRDDYEAAWARYENGHIDALKTFNLEHPEYEARLALFQKPDERLRQFLIDELWSRWNELPKLNRDELKDQLGDLFGKAFISRDTRSYDSISTDMLGVWLKYAGGDPPGSMTLAPNVAPADLTRPDIAWRLQAFYDTREQTYAYNERLFQIQQDYFKLDQGGARRAYRRAHPELEQYWDWRRDFMERNPDLAPYIEDDPTKLPTYSSEQKLAEARAAQPNFTAQEWAAMMPPSAGRLIGDYLNLGMPLPESVTQLLDDLADRVGITRQEILKQMGE